MPAVGVLTEPGAKPLPCVEASKTLCREPPTKAACTWGGTCGGNGAFDDFLAGVLLDMLFSFLASRMSHGIGALFCFVLLRKARKRCCAKELSTLPLLKDSSGRARRCGSRLEKHFPRLFRFQALDGLHALHDLDGRADVLRDDIRGDARVPQEDAEHHRREGAA